MAGGRTSVLSFVKTCIFCFVIKTCFSQFLNTQNGYLSGHVFDSLDMPTAIVCGAKCLQRINCKSFNFHVDDQKCDLSDATKEEYPDDFKTGEEATYHIRQLELYQNYGDPCKDNQCASSSRCVPKLDSYICVCLPGRMGQYCNQKCHIYQTSDADGYVFIPEISMDRNIVEFNVKAERAVFVALTAEPTIPVEFYEIVIGGWENTRSVIRPCTGACTTQAFIDVNTPNILDSSNFVEFYVSYFNGHINVGKIGEQPFMSTYHETPFPINFLGIKTNNNDGEWKICDYKPMWSDWSAWSNDCTTTCGTGVRVRHRVCGKLTSEFGKCPGDKMEYEPCHGENTTCPEWSMWSKAFPCSTHTSCGLGTVTRQRYCMDGWTNCEGETEEIGQCYSPSCQVPWRLVGGSRLGQGRLEVYHDIRNTWGTVTYDGWDSASTAVACRTLGYIPTPSYPEQGYDSLCDNGWMSYKGNCYLGSGVLSKRRFRSAEDYCNNKVANLVSILSNEENEFIISNFFGGSDADIWIGAHNFYGSNYYSGPYESYMTWINGDNLTLYHPGFAEEIAEAPGEYQQVCAWLDAIGNWRLSNCEIERYFACKKLSLQKISLIGKSASQRSTYRDHGDNASASRAIDGDTDGDHNHGSCAITGNKHHGEWWMVDLGESVCIDRVVIYNRIDMSPERIVGARITIGDDDGQHNPECTAGSPITQADVDAGDVFHVACDLTGRYISIGFDSSVKEHLQLCEVEAYGCATDSTCADEWKEYGDYCYLQGTEIMTFQNAHDQCSSYDAFQVTITSADEDGFVLDNFLNSSSDSNYGIWLGAHNGESVANGPFVDTLKWIDGSSLTYLPGFQESVPLFQGSHSRACGYMQSDGSWHITQHCQRNKYFVCKKEPIFSLDFTPGDGTILLKGMTCNGTETHLSQCTHAGWYNTDGGSHNRDVGLKCGVNGHWSEWSSWNDCPEDCSSNPTSVRTRTCDDPAPILNGETCSGDSSETQTCVCAI
ncbi:uncharacterized protein [Amphiura filiformis]|uniref:uncharacterized protein n=1 Tax=Amphiura filiformis TaxID=82378 RepID=UPI003B20C673